MGELIYTFASIASRFKNGTTALTGMRRLADTLHPLGVPLITTHGWPCSAPSKTISKPMSPSRKASSKS